MHGHGQVSERTYRAIHRHCSEAMLRSGVGISDPCQTSLDFMDPVSAATSAIIYTTIVFTPSRTAGAGRFKATMVVWRHCPVGQD